MKNALTAEFRKFWSTRMWWILALACLGYMVFLGAVMGFSFAFNAESMSDQQGGQILSGVDAATTVYSITSPLGYVFPLVIGSLLFTNEFRHQTITSSLLVEPRRSILVVAKLVIAGVFGLLIGVLATAGTVLGSAPFLEFMGDGAYLGDGDVLAVLGWSVVVMAIWTVMGVAVGGLLKNQVAAIIVLIGFTQFVEPMARLAGTLVDELSGIAKFLPGAAADAITGASFFSADGTGAGGLLDRWEGALVLAVYVAIFALGARFITLRRDIG